MPRPRGPHGRDGSIALAVRVAHELHARMQDAAGAEKGSDFAEWLRNIIRRGVGVPLDYKAGYEEGKAAGWTEAQARFRAAMKDA